MNTLTPTESQAYLAKQLREKIHLESYGEQVFYCWNNTFQHKNPDAHKIKETEWLYIAHEVEGKMTDEQFDLYIPALAQVCYQQRLDANNNRMCSQVATYTQRATAMKESGV